MPYGTGPLLGQALKHASPWQRYLIAVALIAGGVMLVLIGHVTGVLLSLGGVLLLGRMVRYRLRRRRQTHGAGSQTA